MDDYIAPVETGNVVPATATKPSGGKRSYSWGPCTWNSYPSDWKHILNLHCEKFVCQIEIGDSGNEHLQFFCLFKNAKTFSAVAKIFPGAHLELTENRFAAANYCKKSRTAVEGSLIIKGWGVKKPVKDPLEGHVPHDWQQEIIDLIATEPDDRKIYWYWERTGNIGKSSLVKHLYLRFKDKGILPVSGKAADMKHLVHGYLETHELDAVLVDLVRSREQYVSYEGIEEIKNGLIVNTKYETAVNCFNCPHVIVFSNWPPDLSALSADRWIVRDLNTTKSVIV